MIYLPHNVVFIEKELLLYMGGLAVDNFIEMDGYQFEEYISNLFRKMGFAVEATDYSNDGGIDLVATYEKPIFSGKYIIQCKNWNSPVGQPAVRDLYGVVMDQRANKGILITPSDYTQQAYDFARGKNIELINGSALRQIISDAFGFDATTAPLAISSFRDDRYMYYQNRITEEPKVADNYVRMINYLREYVKNQDTDACSIDLFEDIIRWAEQLIARCYKAPSKASDKQIVQLIQAEAYIHIGKLAEATEILLKSNQFWIQTSCGLGSRGRDGNHYGYSHIISWNLYVAFSKIKYKQGCSLLVSRIKRPETDPSYLGTLFVYPHIRLSCLRNQKTYHIWMNSFRVEESRNPAFFIDRFYKKTPEEYAKEIDAVLRLHGII